MAKRSSSSNISGTISYTDGTPASGLTIKVFSSTTRRKEIIDGQTDDEGRFIFSNLPFNEEDEPILRVYKAGERNSIHRKSISLDADHNSTISIKLDIPPHAVSFEVEVEPQISVIDGEPGNVEEQQPEAPPPAWSRRLSNIRMAFEPGKRLGREFATAFAETSGDLTRALESLGDQMDDEYKHRVQVINTLSDLADDDETVIEKMVGEIGPSLDMLSFASQPDVRGKLESIVTEVATDVEPEKISERTDRLYSRLFMAQPTAVLLGMVGDKAVLPITHRAAVKETLENGMADFDIRKDPIHKLFDRLPEGLGEKDREETKTELKTLQRLSAISLTSKAIPVLFKAGLHSAFAVSEIPRAQFISQFEGELGKEVAEAIYENAGKSRLRSELFLMASKEALKGTGIAAVDKSIDKNGKGKLNIDWDLLFGDADICECGECNSVYSPAAYFVELLQYLRNNNLGPVGKKNTPKDNRDISGTPLEKLLSRRPDLGCLELTCKNAFTLLPYVDLVNEVLENYVVYQEPKAFNVEEDQTSGELLSQPFHTNYEAYCILSKAVYPFTLPYHQPIDAARIYLDYLGTSRHELLDTFRSACQTKDQDADRREKLKVLHEERRQRAVDAEYLGLTEQEYVILTREKFTSKAYLEFCNDKVITNEEYQNQIGVVPEHKYFGYDSKDDMIQGLTLVKDQFLRRTGINYTDLVELLTTHCLNPYRPEGKALAISLAIPFSYRYLQNRFQTDKNPSGKKQILEYLLAERKRIQGLENNQPEECTGGRSNPETVIHEDDLKWWVECYFEDIGKMIVLESGNDCQCPDGSFLYIQNGQQVNLYLSPLRGILEGRDDVAVVLRNCKIGIVPQNNPEGTFIKEIGSLDRYTGRIIFRKSDGTELKLGDDSNIYLSTGDRDELGVIRSGHLFRMIADETVKLWACGIFNKDNCNLDNIRLKHLNGEDLTEEEYARIHRFIRLWRKLGWTIDEVDKALAAGLAELPADDPESKKDKEACCDDLLGELKEDCIGLDTPGQDSKKCPPRPAMECRITPALLSQLATVKKLQSKTGMEVAKLLTFWVDISTLGDKSLYKRLFLTHNLTRQDSVFKADGDGNVLLQNTPINEHLPVLMAALNLSADDIQSIVAHHRLDGTLTLSNVSMLYRYRLLSRHLGVRIPEFIDVEQVFGNPFATPADTHLFMKNWEKMQDAGFDYRTLNYILHKKDDPKKPLEPSKITILRLLKTLFDGLNQIESAHRNLSDSDQPDAGQLRAKATLLFDTALVEDIVAIVEGTTIYSTQAPPNLDDVTRQLDPSRDVRGVAISPVLNSLRRKVMYDATNGILTVTGLFFEQEVTALKQWSNAPDWEMAISTLEKNQKRWFDEIFNDIINEEKRAPGIDPAAISAIETELRKGDLVVPVPNPPVKDPNTLPVKIRKFMELYLPYLRRRLSQRLIVDTLSSFTQLERAATDALISTVLQEGGKPLAEVFADIKSLSSPEGKDWTGFLIPPADAEYRFFVTNTQDEPVIDGLGVKFTKQEGTLRDWETLPVALKAGRLYRLTLDVQPGKLQWKTATTKKALIPAAQWLPDYSDMDAEKALSTLHRIALLVSGFNLSADELLYIHKHSADFSKMDFQSLKLEHWLRLEAYTRLRNSLPKTNTNLLEFFEWASNTNDSTHLAAKVSALTRWKQERVEKLISAKNYNLLDPAHFRNEEQLLRLHKALQVADKIGMDMDLLFKWAHTSSTFKDSLSIAESIRNAIRGRYRQEDWEQVAKPLHDKLRANQRNALVAWILQRPELIRWGVTDADGLFEYFLIDVQMQPCMESSRIKQAISSVQLFIQRCFLGLEEEKSGIAPDKLDRDRWNWMQRYRVWEANRKVFLYPENWIEPNLRDDKSPFFKELESELLQKDINKQNVTDALKSYLYKVDEVANMEVVGLYVEAGEKLHVFSRTRNAPYFFYYRYFDLSEGYWYPWEKMQVDIPSYDVENEQGQVKGNGCYLTPVVWRGRLLIFFPQFMKKTKANENSSKSFKGILDNDSPISSKPFEFRDIKLGWSEYRNGKWTQKQLSSKSVNCQLSDVKGRGIEEFTFIPKVEDDKIIIVIEDQYDQNLAGLGSFTFNGSHFDSDIDYPGYPDPPILQKIGGQLNFQKGNNTIGSTQVNTIRSIQVNSGMWGGQDAHFIDDNNSVLFKLNNKAGTLNFYSPDTRNLFNKVDSNKLQTFFSAGYSLADKNDAYGKYDSNFDDQIDQSDIFHELKRPYSLYNWELFFHAPAVIADVLTKARQHEEARNWFHYIFNPLNSGEGETKEYWKFLPFREMDSQRVLDSIFNQLQPNVADSRITAWRNNPFQPHLIARDRPVAYMKWVVMKYIDNLIAWGDELFRQDTIESINEATQLYIMAGHILGPRPQFIPKRGKVQPQTYLSMLDKWDAFSNAMTELELVQPYSSQITEPSARINGETAYANIFGFASTLYFCIPNNPKLMGYWDTVADRLFKIRHCQNILGVFRKLALFEPPIDPGLLVRAAAQGLSISGVLNDLNTPMPNYRFYYLLQKALELCNELKSLGGAMLSAIEKRDNETIALMRARHESSMHNLVMEVKKQQLEEAIKSVESLRQNRKSPESRMKYYLQLAGEDSDKVPVTESDFTEITNDIEAPVDEGGLKLTKYEKEELDKANLSANLQLASGIPETLAGILYALPMLAGDVKPLGVGAGASFGGTNLGQLTQTVSKGLQIAAGHLSHQSSTASKKAGYQRALQDRIQQANTAGYEIKQIDKQILAQQIRIDIANLEINNQQKQIDNSREVEDFLRNKFSDEELYTWMRDSLKTLYGQVYSLALDLAKKAEKVYRMERGLSDSGFIKSGYMEAGREGLLAGEHLYVGLKQLEAAYHENKGYDYEITKHVSLRQLNPKALLELRITGKCEFELPEYLFDLEYPGHYRRRIKSVSMSIPCVIGPYTGINATLRLQKHHYRHTDNAAAYQNPSEDDIKTNLIPVTSIAISTAQNDSGLFELNFKDERYLPFEGAGVISSWQLELPEVRQFDYETITDVVVHVRYTSCQGSDSLKKAAARATRDYLNGMNELGRQQGMFSLIDLKNDMPNQWHQVMRSTDRTSPGRFDLSTLADFLPYFVRINESNRLDFKRIKINDMWLIHQSELTKEDLSIIDSNQNSLEFVAGSKIGDAEVLRIQESEISLSGLSLIINDFEKAKSVSRMYLIVRYKLSE